MRDSHASIERAGGRLVVVLCQKHKAVAGYVERNPTPFPIVADEDRSLARSWGVYHGLGIDAVNIARPAAFVVDPEGTIRFAWVAATQFQTADIEELLGLIIDLAR